MKCTMLAFEEPGRSLSHTMAHVAEWLTGRGWNCTFIGFWHVGAAEPLELDAEGNVRGVTFADVEMVIAYHPPAWLGESVKGRYIVVEDEEDTQEDSEVTNMVRKMFEAEWQEFTR